MKENELCLIMAFNASIQAVQDSQVKKSMLCDAILEANVCNVFMW